MSSIIGLEVREEIGRRAPPYLPSLQRFPGRRRLFGDLPPAGLDQPVADHLVEEGLVLERERGDLPEEMVDRR